MTVPAHDLTAIITITHDTVAILRTLPYDEIVLPNVIQIDDLAICLLRELSEPRIISLPKIEELSASTALELANGFRAELKLPGIHHLSRNTLRALCCWKRGWITFPNLRSLDADTEHFELALQCGNISIVRLLIEKGAFSPNHLFRNRNVPILIAGQQLNAAMIRLLIELGANANAQSHKDGDTVLHLACRARSNGLINFLLEHVDRSLKNLNGRIAMDEYVDNDPMREKLMPPSPPPLY